MQLFNSAVMAAKAAIDGVQMNECGCVPARPDFQKQAVLAVVSGSRAFI